VTQPLPRLTKITRAIRRLHELRDSEIIRLYTTEDVLPKQIGEMAEMHMTSILRLLHRKNVDTYGPGRPAND
jgi:hypothetical protein